MSWPPSLPELKSDLGIDDDRDNTRLASVLAASIAYVERVRASAFNFAADPDSDLPDPTDDLVLGTLRLAGRYHARRRSVDGLISAGELGSTRIPWLDADIERLLGIGRYRKAVFA